MPFVNTVDIIGDEALSAKILDRTITEIADDISPDVGQYAFYTCTQLTTVDMPNVKTIGTDAFRGCYALLSAKFHSATDISIGGGHAFHDCTHLITADFSAATAIGIAGFYNCASLTAMIIRSGTVCALQNNNAFNNTPIKSGTGHIYVPAALVDSYKAATNWSTYAAQFRALEDYTVDGTTTGELDPNKI